MKKFILIILCFLMASCDKSFFPFYSLKWATVDKRKVEQKLKIIAEEQNPYPSQYQYEKESLEDDYRKTRSQISDMEARGKQQCAIDEKTGAKPLYVTPGNVRTINIEPRHYNRDSDNEQRFDAECLAMMSQDQEIIDLKEKYDAIRTVRLKQRTHDSYIAKAVDAKTISIIQAYAKGKFDVVIEDKANILFNKDGISLEVTSAVITFIDNTNVKITIPPVEINTELSDNE